jgi:RNA polymerase sigma factor (sigma-70 family)
MADSRRSHTRRTLEGPHRPHNRAVGEPIEPYGELARLWDGRERCEEPIDRTGDAGSRRAPERGRAAGRVLDEYLVVRSQLGDADAFAELVRRWNARLRRHAAFLTRDGEAAKDVVQESWLAIVRGLGSLHDPGRFRAWAHRIVANKARDWVRREDVRRRAARAMELRPALAQPARPARSSDPAAPGGPIDVLRAGLAALEPEKRHVLTLFYLEEMSVAEIAEALDVPAGTVKSRLFHARQALIARLKEE